MNYRNKQNIARLSEWYVARQLGMKINDYLDVLRGKKNLANDKLDLFLKITDKKNKEWINQEQEKEKINTWYNGHTVDELIKLFNDFKVDLIDVSKELGISKSLISMVRTKKINSENGKALLYYYFNDENNRRNEYRKESKNKKTSTLAKIDVPKTTTVIDKEGITSKVNSDVLWSAFKTSPYSIRYGIKHEGNQENSITMVRKEDYDRVLKEKQEIEEELARYKYLIDMLRSR